MKKINPWCNETAYPVDPIIWSNDIKYSRLDAATLYSILAKKKLADIIISSNGSVVDAVDGINNIFKMKNDFPIFMAVMDIAWFRPDIIKPNSNVPVGIGAVAYIDRLKSFLGKETDEEIFSAHDKRSKKILAKSKKTFFPIDIEYLCCECRKYYSYVRNEKFEGKTFFSLKLSLFI